MKYHRQTNLGMKKKKSENMIVNYPQYCKDCYLSFVNSKRNVNCIRCNSDNVVNCYGEVKNKIQKFPKI